MTDEKPPGEDEDLFEDLDKFFAPIESVDWPEPEESLEGAVPKPASPAEEHVSVSEPPSTSVFEAVAAGAVDEPEEPEEAEADEAAFQIEEGSDAVAGQTSDQGLIETTQQPAASADVEVVAEIVDEGVEVVKIEDEFPEDDMGLMVGSEVPSETEAAAEHFAESVRVETPDDVEREILADLDEPDEVAPVRVSASEGLQGPSWQEPTHEEIGAAEPGGGPSAGRNVPLAFVTGAAMVAIALGALAINKDLFAALAGIVVLFGQAEFYGAVRKRHFQPAPLIGLVFGALILYAGYTSFSGEAAMLSMVALAFIFCILWEMATPARHRRHVLANIGVTMLGIIYIPLMAGFAMVLLSLDTPSGTALILAVLGLTVLYDTVAFGVGSFWGEHQLAPNISPRKSWEGAVVASLVVVAVSVLFVSSIEPLGWGGAAGLAAVVMVMAPLGDLAESLLKRDLGIKDMGTILPGHGGVLDRIDSILLVAPIALMFLRAVL